VPEHRIPQLEHLEILKNANGMNRGEKLLLQRIYSHSGIESRHSVLEEFAHDDNDSNVLFHPAGVLPAPSVSRRMELYEMYAPDLCAGAVSDCLGQLPSLERSRITHVITFSCTGMHAPGIDMQLVEKFGLNRNVERTCINFMGCYAGINALKTAWHIGRSQPNAVVLVAGVELCTLHYQKSNVQDQVVANAIFADGAAACIVSSAEIESPAVKLRLQNFYAEFEPAGKDEMVWRIGEQGFDLKLSAYVPALVKENIHALTEKLFHRSGISQEEISCYAIHPGGVKILEACEAALNISKEQNAFSYEVLRKYGNMSAVTVVFVLQLWMRSFTADDKGKKLLACAFGPGLTMESLVAEVC
jgi:predicted naringenin-chalcone synthase